MRIEIDIGDSKKTIEVRTKLKHENAYFDKIAELKKIAESEGGDEFKSTKEFIDFENELAVECSTITKEEYDDLYSEDRNKIKVAIRKMVFPHTGGDPANFY